MPFDPLYNHMRQLLLISFLSLCIVILAHGQEAGSYARASDSTSYMLISNDTIIDAYGPFVEAFSQFDHLHVPWNIQYERDGWLWVTERNGRISRMDLNTGENQLLLVLPSAPDGRIFITTSNLDRRNIPAEDDDKILELMLMD